MKNKIKTIIVGIVCFAFGLSFVIVSYANSYSSSEISYDTSTSGAMQNNVKAALDFLYNKTKSGAASECPENMSCVLKPGVTLNVSGPGTVDKGTVYIGLNESNTFTVTPNDGYVLTKLECNNGYTLSSYYDSLSATSKSQCDKSQTITITNPGTTTGSTCDVYFGSYDFDVSSTNFNPTYRGDSCNNNGDNCICYKIKNNIKDFTYGSHTGCNFKSTSCYYMDGRSFNCNNLCINHDTWGSYNNWCNGSGQATDVGYCSGVITCAT